MIMKVLISSRLTHSPFLAPSFPSSVCWLRALYIGLVIELSVAESIRRRLFARFSSIVRSEGLLIGERSKQKRRSDGATTEDGGLCAGYWRTVINKKTLIAPFNFAISVFFWFFGTCYKSLLHRPCRLQYARAAMGDSVVREMASRFPVAGSC